MRKLSFAVLAAALAAGAAQVPAGGELEIRLKTKVSSKTSKPKDAVEAALIRAVVIEDQIALPAGLALRGEVREVKASTKPEERAELLLVFSELKDAGGKNAALSAEVAEVDNARETVGEKGRIVGILASETITARLDQAFEKLAQYWAWLAQLLGKAKSAVLKEADPDIVYEPGVEMTLKLASPLDWTGSTEGPRVEVFADQEEVARLAAAQPFQTVAEKPPKPSDITNLMFIGTAEEVKAAFVAAGWNTAAELNAKSGLETFRAVAENRGYKEAPMSVLLLEGAKAEMDLQKQNNTFAKRHHLRVWRRPVSYLGKPVWVSAATHDVGIEFSPENRTFIHKIDSKIDRERAKVVSDLLFAGHVKALALVDRPDVPRETRNATGDAVATDGMMAVMLLGGE